MRGNGCLRIKQINRKLCPKTFYGKTLINSQILAFFYAITAILYSPEFLSETLDLGMIIAVCIILLRS
jgi:hypothetical protein